MDATTFWNNLNSLIKERKTTQEALCKECAINIGTFKNRSSNKIVPNAIETYKIAQALNTTVEYLVTGTSTNPAEQELKELKEQFRKLLKP